MSGDAKAGEPVAQLLAKFYRRLGLTDSADDCQGLAAETVHFLRQVGAMSDSENLHVVLRWPGGLLPLQPPEMMGIPNDSRAEADESMAFYMGLSRDDGALRDRYAVAELRIVDGPHTVGGEK